MSNYRITPKVVLGYDGFRLDKLSRLLWIQYWRFVGYYTTREEAERAIAHLERKSIYVSTEQP
jgi:hypothetical protein